MTCIFFLNSFWWVQWIKIILCEFFGKFQSRQQKVNNYNRVEFTPRSLINRLKRNGPNTDPCGTPDPGVNDADFCPPHPKRNCHFSIYSVRPEPSMQNARNSKLPQLSQQYTVINRIECLGKVSIDCMNLHSIVHCISY